jgi:hypothetical protein
MRDPQGVAVAVGGEQGQTLGRTIDKYELPREITTISQSSPSSSSSLKEHQEARWFHIRSSLGYGGKRTEGEKNY